MLFLLLLGLFPLNSDSLTDSICLSIFIDLRQSSVDDDGEGANVALGRGMVDRSAASIVQTSKNLSLFLRFYWIFS